MVLKDNKSEKENFKSSDVKKILSFPAAFVIAVFSGLVSDWINKDILHDTFTITVIIAFIIVFLLAYFIQTKWLHLQLKTYYILVATITLVIIEGLVLAWLYINTRPSTVYIVFDATEKTQPFFNEIINQIEFTTQIQNTNTIIGLRVYGSHLNNMECNDTEQLIKPIPLKEFTKQFDLIKGSIEPQGHASLTIAILGTLKNDLINNKGPIKIIIITSGIDYLCEPQKGGIFEENAKDIQQNIRKDINILIIGVGSLQPDESKVLKNYAQAYNGVYRNITNADSLASIILESSGNSDNYVSYLKLTQTP